MMLKREYFGGSRTVGEISDLVVEEVNNILNLDTVVSINILKTGDGYYSAAVFYTTKD